MCSLLNRQSLACLLFTLQYANLFAYLLFLCVNKFTHLLFYQYVNELFVSNSQTLLYQNGSFLRSI